MELYVFRHGIAEDRQAGRPDADRQLTDEGRKKTAGVIRKARDAGVEPSLILTSPYARALETARIAAEGFGYKGQIVRAGVLEPGGTPEAVWNELLGYRDEPAVLIAGHEPLLSHLMSYLLASPALRIEL